MKTFLIAMVLTMSASCLTSSKASRPQAIRAAQPTPAVGGAGSGGGGGGCDVDQCGL